MINYGAYAGVGAIGFIALIAIWIIKRKCKKGVKVYGDGNISTPRDRSSGSGESEQCPGGEVIDVREREQNSDITSGRSGELGQDGRREEVQIDSDKSTASNEQTVESDSSSVADSEQDFEEEDEDFGEEEIEIPIVED